MFSPRLIWNWLQTRRLRKVNPRSDSGRLRLLLEPLESRIVPSRNDELIVITHGGLQDRLPDWVYDKATAINVKAGYGNSPAQIRNSRMEANLERGESQPTGGARQFLLFDWADESCLLCPGTADEPEVAGQLAGFVRQRLRELPAGGKMNIQFIGHSRGNYANAAAIRLLTAEEGARLGFVQMTILDAAPHNVPFFTDGTLDVPASVFVDNYFQEDPLSPIWGAKNFGADVEIDLTNVVRNWASGNISHSEVRAWWQWTIDTVDSHRQGYEDDQLDAQEAQFVREHAAGVATTRSLLFGSLHVDLDMDGRPDLLAGGSKIGFHYSLGGELGPRTFAGFGGLDLVFVIDVTGSMSDDIDAVKAAAVNMVSTVARLVPDYRIGIVTYKDFPEYPFGDPGDFPSRTTLPFTTNSATVVSAIQGLTASGGGDTEESVYSALVHAIEGRAGLGSWRGGRIRKAIILMGDAPPHDPEPVTGLTRFAVTKRAVDADPVDVFAVGIGTDTSALATFESVSQANGGTFLTAPRAEDVVAALTRTIEEVAPPGTFQFSAASYSIREGGGSITITVTRTNGSASDVTVRYATRDDTARAGEDYAATSGTLAFGPGETSKSFTIAITDDNLVKLGRTLQVGRTFEVFLSDPTGGSLGSPVRAMVAIEENDWPRPSNLGAAALGFAKSREHYTKVLTNAYERFLKRPPESEAPKQWVDLMMGIKPLPPRPAFLNWLKVPVLTEEELEAAIISSPEYLERCGGLGEGWIQCMYNDLFGRPPDVVVPWMEAIGQGTPPYPIALVFTTSDERASGRIRHNYRKFLEREPSQAEADGWLAIFRSGLHTNQDIVAGFIGSFEFWKKESKGDARPAVWVARVYEEVLGRWPSNDEVTAWLDFLGPR